MTVIEYLLVGGAGGALIEAVAFFNRQASLLLKALLLSWTYVVRSAVSLFAPTASRSPGS
ncbi:hypothetical protein [Streptomyces sp. NPDC048419]|uniref:hypothetical protein n=1 Tax=Streptomyces sp. NPDC048419 TaxID=3365547 RepID=UPI0037173746